jgi:hypothetical protein
MTRLSASVVGDGLKIWGEAVLLEQFMVEEKALKVLP